MPAQTHDLDLAGLRLSSGEGRRMDLAVGVDALDFAGERYAVEPEVVPVSLEVSRMVGHGYALRLRFQAQLSGPCMRCLRQASPPIEVDAREVDTLKGAGRPGGGEELSSPYVRDEVLDLSAWARDAFALAVPIKILCRVDCAGLCPVCAADLNEAGAEHRHEQEPDPRWAKLRELKLD
jgi:uncharacterized protein